MKRKKGNCNMSLKENIVVLGAAVGLSFDVGCGFASLFGCDVSVVVLGAAVGLSFDVGCGFASLFGCDVSGNCVGAVSFLADVVGGLVFCGYLQDYL
ncbi:Hypothetical predicted protein [Octopus vulgaris]|uniref:Uncharacterized protein n=1 Tax=Octopus vulgaris TaxID=6645 RepID=A0AA36FJD7_OCTVU|nr:Hypothetical predicted protein [Octopus vulgaris]